MRWEDVPERGSLLGMRSLLLLARLFGYAPGALCALSVAAFHWMGNPRSRRASALYLARVGALPANASMPARWAATLRHHASFALNLYDRIWLWMGREDLFRIERSGQDIVLSLQGKGALLVGAHVGSFDLLRVISEASPARVHAVMYPESGAKFLRLLNSVNPKASVSAILLDGSIEQVFELQALIDKGDLVALMADRQTPGSTRERTVEVPFLGAAAHFPVQAWRLAAILGCPVVLVSAVRDGWRSYRASAVEFSPRLEIPRKGREEALRTVVGRFSRELEGLCSAYPYQWFNFFDFWEGKA